MQDRVNRGKKGRRFFSFLDGAKRILIFAALAAVTALALRPVQTGLQERIGRIRDDLTARVEEFSGRKIQYGSMGPSVFGVLDIRDVLVLREDGSILLSVSRLRLSYSLLELIRGNTANAFHSVRIDRPVLSLDFDKDRDLGERFASLTGRRSSPGGAGQDRSSQALLPEVFSLRVWNGEWDLSGRAGKFKLQGLGLDADVRQSRIMFHGRWSAEASLNRGVVPGAGEDWAALLTAAMTGRISGEYAADTGEGSAAVVIPSLAGGSFRLKPLTVSFFLSGSRIEARKTHDRSPAAFSLLYDRGTGLLQGRFEGENFPLRDLAAFTGPWRAYDPLLAFRITGSAGFERETSGSLSYSADFSGGLPRNASFGEGSLALKVYGDNGRISSAALDLRSAYGDISFRGGLGFDPVTPDGSLTVSNFSLRRDRGPAPSGGLSGAFHISTRGREISVFGENINSGGVDIPVLDALLVRQGQGIDFSASLLRFRNIESYEDVRMSTMSLEGFMDRAEPGGNPPRIEASLKIDSFSTGDILRFAGPIVELPFLPDLAGSAAEDLSVTTELFFSADHGDILYNAPRIVAAYEGLGNVLAAASLSGTNRRFELNEGRISWEDGSAALSGSADFSDPADVSFSTTVSYKDLAYYFDGMILDQRNVSVRGSYGFQASLSAGAAGTYSGYIQAENIPLPSGEGLASLTFLFSLFYASPADWEAGIGEFEITGLNTPSSPSALVRFSGRADERGMDIPDIFFDDGRGALGGKLSLEWDSSYSFCGFSGELSGTARNEYYGIGGVYRGGVLELSLSGRGMQFSRVSPYNAVADGSFRLSWESPSSFNAEAELGSLVLPLRENILRASASASMDADSFNLRALTVNYAGLEASLPRLSVNRTLSTAETEAVIRGGLSGRPVDISCRASASFNPAESWFDMFRGIDALECSLTVDTARFDTIEAGEPFGFSFSCLRGKAGLSMNLTGGPRNMVRFRYSPETAAAAGPGAPPAGGSFYAALSAPSPVRGSVTGSIGPGTIDAQGTDLYADLGALWRFIPRDTVVAFPGGIVTASVRITGPLEDPEFYGSARGTSVQILVPEYLREPIRPVPVNIALNGEEMVFGPVDAAVGNGVGKASGWFRFEQWIPDIFSIDIQVPQETPVPYGFDISGVLAHGSASGKMVVARDGFLLTVTGDVTAHNTEISLSNEFGALEFEDSRSSVTTSADITVKAGKRVEFFWPSVEFPILQAYTDMGTGIRIATDTASRRFSLTGDLRLRTGELFYLRRNFYLREGTIFFNENEAQFDPRISARAEIRDQTDDGPVTISLIIDNAPLMSFTPRFESSPPLSQLEIYSILGQNPQGDAGEGGQTNVAAAAFADLLTQFTVMRRLQRTVRDFMGLDMFSIRTSILQNAVIQATSTQPVDRLGTESRERPSRFGNYFNNTTVYIGKYFSPQVFGQAMLSLRYDEKKQTYGGLILEPEFGLEVRNPIFDIQLNMVPLHPENWFLDDVSISLIWRRSF